MMYRSRKPKMAMSDESGIKKTNKKTRRFPNWGALFLVFVVEFWYIETIKPIN